MNALHQRLLIKGKPPPQAVMRGTRKSMQGFMPRIHLFSSQFHPNMDDEKG